LLTCVSSGLCGAGWDAAAILAIHARAGLEDYAGPGEPSNLDLLRAAVALVEGLGRAPATTAQARQILGVPFSRRPV
jgi:uncharacterized protein (DUF849 family)